MRTLQDIKPGQMLGRYELLVPIAEGGMAAVWAARLKGSRGFSKTVAVKTMLPEVSDDPQFEQMFLDEAQIASRIRHPNVVEIIDLGEQDEVLYLVMEWIDGEPLGGLRRAAAKLGGIPRDLAVRIVSETCAGLHAAHELKDDTGQPLGLVHRDISPQNVLVTYGGVVKIVDFGVAKAAGRSAEATTAGEVKGKPPYMSPEQALGEAVDRRTDVFALGIILYQLTTGKHPFRGESDLVTLQNIVSDKPIVLPRAYDRQYPRLLGNVVMKALERDLTRRFQSCAELEAALDEVFATELVRPRAEDVGRFVSETLGKKGEARRKRLKEAVRLADERAVARGSYVDLSEARAAMPSDGGTPVSNPSVSGLSSAAAGDAPGTPYDAALPSANLPLRRSPLVALGAVAAVAIAAAGATFAFRGGEPATDPAGLQSAGETNAAAILPEPKEEPVAEQAASGAKQGTAAGDAGALEQASVDSGVAAASASAAPAPAPKRTRWKPRRTKPAAKKPADKPPPQKKKSTGFVPPPLTDPGF